MPVLVCRAGPVRGTLSHLVVVLGLSGYAHDSAVAVVEGSRILAFAEEERFNREKHTGAFPDGALHWALASQGLDLSDVDEVAFYVRPWLLIAARAVEALRYLPRSVPHFLARSPANLLGFLRVGSRLRHAALPARNGHRFRVRPVDHHLAHAASAFHVSGFDEAAILSLDGAGERITTWFGRGAGNRIERLHAIVLPHSLGLFYSAVTHHLGFRPWGGEGKVMGLAPYGDPDRFYRPLREVVRWSDDGDLTIDLRFVEYHVSGWQRWTSPAFAARFGPRREPESELRDEHRDLAAALQRVTEEAALALLRHLHRLAPSRHLCLAGGVALNSVMNGRLAREGPFERLFIQPAANDAGTALGAALYRACSVHGRARPAPADLVYLGPAFDHDRCETAARAAGLEVERPADVAARTADLLAGGRIVGWFQGRMEVGPRALGNRSILADPRDPTMRDTLNRRVKRREAFRPFAPSVLAEEAAAWFTDVRPSPFMSLVFSVRPDKRARIPAVTHVDGSARVHTVTREANPRYHALLSAFAARTGVPMVLNTSFNVRGEPIVCTPEDAVRCFLGTELDALVLDELVCWKPGTRRREGRR